MTEELGPITLDARDSGRSRRRVWWFGCSGLLLVCLGLVFVLLFGDGPPPDDADLLPPPRVEIPDSENLYAALAALHPRYDEPRDFANELRGATQEDGRSPLDSPWRPSSLDHAYWTAVEDLDGVAEYLRDIEPVLSEIEAALELPSCQLPHQESTAEPFTGFQVFKDAHRQFAQRALIRRVRGDLGAASRDLSISLRLGGRLIQDAETLIDLLIGVRIVQQSWEGLESILHDGELDPGVEALLLARDLGWAEDPEWMTRVLLHEYRLIKGVTASLASGEDEMSDADSPLLAKCYFRLYFKKNRALGRFVEVYRELHTLAKQPPTERIPSPQRRDSKAWGLLTGSMIYDSLSEMIMTGMVPALAKIDRGLLVEQTGRAQIALRVHEREHGALPADLDAIVASIPGLESVPIDPWSGAPLRYDPARRILWAVGEDGIDGNGDGWEALRDDPEAERYSLPDWIWPIPPLPGGG